LSEAYAFANVKSSIQWRGARNRIWQRTMGENPLLGYDPV